MRLIPSIGKMTPEQIMRKRPFSVPVPSGVVGTAPIINPATAYAVPLDNVARELRTQSDFLREYHTTSHKINSIKYYKQRIIFINKIYYQS